MKEKEKATNTIVNEERGREERVKEVNKEKVVVVDDTSSILSMPFEVVLNKWTKLVKGGVSRN